jgi:hypothetical protein
LQGVIVAESLLQRMQAVRTRRQAFDGGDLMTVGLHRQHDAGARRAPVE